MPFLARASVVITLPQDGGELDPQEPTMTSSAVEVFPGPGGDIWELLRAAAAELVEREPLLPYTCPAVSMLDDNGALFGDLTLAECTVQRIDELCGFSASKRCIRAQAVIITDTHEPDDAITLVRAMLLLVLRLENGVQVEE